MLPPAPGGGGRLPWTRGNFANRLAAMSIFESAERGARSPHLPTRAIVLPSWQLTTSYGHRIGGDPLPIGGIIVTCDAGRYTVEKHYHNWIDDGFKTL